MHLCLIFTLSLTSTYSFVYGLTTPEDLARTYSLTVSTTLPFPTATLSSSDADQFLIDNWTLNKNKIQNQPNDVVFVADPFPDSPINPALSSTINNSTSSSSSPVLQVTYPEGSFEDSDGGIQFYSLFNGSLPSPQSMLLSYELAFDQGFQWVKGGKLPGLRGGKDTDGCEGGNLPNGTDCWSARLMWRTGGQAEIYTYIPTSDNLCSDAEVICNSDFGTSLNRGAVSYASGEWMQVALFVQLNSRGNLANGNMALFAFIINYTTESKSSLIDANRTFFGGNDPSWATPLTQNTYFRQFRLWASENPSNLTGIPVSSTIRSQSTRMNAWIHLTIFTIVVTQFIL
ncbi:hypothetical protein Clacol_000268 [Clathrus columnatus]|uniref:Polysaccharide lyase 14 domain-containing protein n=1 Tax=Clathrus columnatus TaxID=1419009 RepID=A0AAV4ZYP1_9AGAM|nr:hypothetical protein Clacol_000268 [Clathrus columnatus]